MKRTPPQIAPYVVTALVTVSLALAAMWALLLPIFLSPDEDSHYDYAVALYAAGRPMRPAENVVGRDTQPVVAYLMTATHARRQRLDLAVGADPGYGTASYFRKLDRDAPATVGGSLKTRTIEPVPYIARLYPIGYYAAVAGVIAVADRIAHGSALAEFFGARFFSVLLLLSTLPFSYLALRELGLGTRKALALFACTALLPLTAWMAGYVQPDNLVCALVAPIFYLALRRRRLPHDSAATPILGVLLGALAITKIHYFIAVYVPIVAMLASRRRFRFSRSAAADAAWLTIPALAAIAVVDRWLRAAPGSSGVCVLPSNISLAAARGPWYLARFFFQGVTSTLNQSLFPSSGLQSFWLSYTAYRTNTLTVATPSLTRLVEAMLPAFSLVVTALFLVRTFGVLRRLLAVARMRSWISAARVATNNVVLNAYFTYFAILIAVEMYLGGYVPVQGRYWLPFTSAIWLIAVNSAPRALPLKYARPVSRTLLGMILAFDVVASLFTYSSLRARFYSKPHLDPIPSHETLADLSVVTRGGLVRFTGAAVDLRDAVPSKRVVLRIDGRIVLEATAVARPDMLCNMEATLLNTGFEASTRVSAFHPGRHVAAVFIAAPWSHELVDTGVTTSFSTGTP